MFKFLPQCSFPCLAFEVSCDFHSGSAVYDFNSQELARLVRSCDAVLTTLTIVVVGLLIVQLSTENKLARHRMGPNYQTALLFEMYEIYPLEKCASLKLIKIKRDWIEIRTQY